MIAWTTRPRSLEFALMLPMPLQRTIDRLLEVAQRHPEREALVIGGSSITYLELFRSAITVAAAIRRFGDVGGRVAVLADRSLGRYAGFLATMLSGTIYVPLSPNDELERYVAHLEKSQACCLIFDSSTISRVRDLLASLHTPIPLIAFDVSPDIVTTLNVTSRGIALNRDTSNIDNTLRPDIASYGFDLGAYIMFTSGSTGFPKGVVVSHGAVAAYLQGIGEVLEITSSDRISQVFDPTFDLSIHDMLIAWISGACLVPIVPGRLGRLGPTIRDERISIWFSVPSLILTMTQLNLVRCEYLSGLRLSVFCGEPLSTKHVRAWQYGACNSRIVNLYGPTEATIAVSSFRISKASDKAITKVPIGRPFGRNEFVILSPEGDISLQPTAGQEGELGISGPQLADGYLANANATEAKFLNISVSKKDFETARIYRTGDRVRVDDQGNYHFLGRVDDVIRLKNGYFADLSELELVAARLTNSNAAILINKPHSVTEQPQLFCFLVRQNVEDCCPSDLISIFRGALKLAGVFIIDEIPRLINGKVNRGLLSASINTKGRRRANRGSCSEVHSGAMKEECKRE